MKQKRVAFSALSPKRERFVSEYLIDLNATQAAIRAGYSKKTAAVQAFDLLRKPNIQKQIAKAQAKRSERLEITADMWLRELWLIYKADIRNYLDINEDTGAIRAKGFKEMPEGASRAIEAIKEDRMIREDSKGKDSIINEKVTFKMHDKLKAGEMIGKHLGFLKDKMEHTGPDGGPMVMIMSRPGK